MVLKHLAAILLFAGPMFYCGMWMALDPGGLVGLLDFVVRKLVERERTPVSKRIRTGVRVAGVVLTLVAIAI